MSENELNRRIRVLTNSVNSLVDKLDEIGDNFQSGKLSVDQFDQQHDAVDAELDEKVDELAYLTDRAEGKEYPGLKHPKVQDYPGLKY